MSELLVVLALGVIAIAAVFFPLIAGRVRYDRRAALDADVRRYRAAVESGTVCDRCRAANPPESRFCAECGTPLGGTGAHTDPGPARTGGPPA